MFGLLVWQFFSILNGTFPSAVQVCSPLSASQTTSWRSFAFMTKQVSIRLRLADVCLDHLAFSHCSPQKRLGDFCYIPTSMQMLCNALQLIVTGRCCCSFASKNASWTSRRMRTSHSSA